MSTPANSTTQSFKCCAKCGVDLTNVRRLKDAAGLYYCLECHQSPEPQTANRPDRSVSRSFGLVAQVTCPHCWHLFSPADTLWIATHSDLMGDPVLGPEKPKRFLPTRFTPEGRALDARGSSCHELACPRCHLSLPRSVVEAEPLFLSIIGGPKTGKSYFLGAMTWELRKQLPGPMALAFSDADTVTNQQLTEYEATLFLSEDPDKPVAIAKTEESGHQYDQVVMGGHTVGLPRPFLFNLRPLPQHPHAKHSDRLSRVLCLYDNAGESFQPGRDTVASPVTQHLAKSKAMMFLFDPTQEPRFREKCQTLSHDPQLSSANIQRQETLLVEAGLRVRRYANLPPNKKHDRPLLVLVSKSDVWAGLLPGEDLAAEPQIPNAVSSRLSAVDVKRIERISQKLRALLLQLTPELVAAAEDWCQHVVYIPVSALGSSPEELTLSPGASGLFVRPRNVKPHWVTAPLLYMFAKWTTGLIAGNAAAPAATRAPAMKPAPSSNGEQHGDRIAAAAN